MGQGLQSSNRADLERWGHLFSIGAWTLGLSGIEACGIRGELEDQREEIEDTLNMDSLAQYHENHAGIGMSSRKHRIVMPICELFFDCCLIERGGYVPMKKSYGSD